MLGTANAPRTNEEQKAVETASSINPKTIDSSLNTQLNIGNVTGERTIGVNESAALKGRHVKDLFRQQNPHATSEQLAAIEEVVKHSATHHEGFQQEKETLETIQQKEITFEIASKEVELTIQAIRVTQQREEVQRFISSQTFQEAIRQIPTQPQPVLQNNPLSAQSHPSTVSNLGSYSFQTGNSLSAATLQQQLSALRNSLV